MAGFVTITPGTIRADGADTTQNSTQAAINGLASQVQSAINGVTGGRGVPQVLAQSAVPASVTGTLTETVLATIPIPAGAMGPNGELRVSILFTCTGSANTKTFRAYLGAQVFGFATQTTNSLISPYWFVQNANSQTSQITPTNFGNNHIGAQTVSGLSSFSVDTTQTQNLIISGQLSNVGETITMMRYSAEIRNP